MTFNRLLIVLLGLFSATLAFSQISRGGVPYYLQPTVLRSSSPAFFNEMPPFDLDSVLREDALNEENLRGSYQFAHKFHTNISIKDAVQTVLEDGTIVKQIGIRSAGAYSINLLFRDFELPPGGKLFIYSADFSHVIGSFDHRNNSPDKIFPIRPVAGESIIVEYSEPANAHFTGRFTISEVNHDYRDIFRREPEPDKINAYDCMPDVFCAGVPEESIRSTVLLMINGTTACSGSLLNNTADDGKPLVLTAVHCFGSPVNYPYDAIHYKDRSATIVAFFNYNRPVCDPTIKMKGTEEMSVSGASPQVILEGKDIALLEFDESPPDYFNVFYAGWKSDLDEIGIEHKNLHHPSGAVKKYGMTDSKIRITSVPAPAGNYLEANSYWVIPKWKIGSTHGGSSGSPLFDENFLIIGGLTAGGSECTGILPNEKSDYFSALGMGWETDNPANQLKTYLDPKDREVMKYPGLDPHLDNPIIRLVNANYTNGDQLITSKLDTDFIFGKNDLNIFEFAEEFTSSNPIEIFGTYLLIPEMKSPFNYDSEVMVSVYTGNSSPETKIYSTRFIPKFLNYSTSTGFKPENKLLTVPTETFVVFNEPVSIKTEKFFISYSIDNSTSSGFSVYNTKLSDESKPNTAWINHETKGWIPADEFKHEEYQQTKTSLAIHPLIRNNNNTQIEKIEVQTPAGFYYDRAGRMLTLNHPLNNRGQLAVYSIGGQLMESMPVLPDQTGYILRERPKGTIGIVKITGNTFTYTGKIMY